MVYKRYGKKKYQLESRRGDRKQKIGEDWTTHETFITVYDHVYSEMLDAKVATPLDKS